VKYFNLLIIKSVKGFGKEGTELPVLLLQILNLFKVDLDHNRSSLALTLSFLLCFLGYNFLERLKTLVHL